MLLSTPFQVRFLEEVVCYSLNFLGLVFSFYSCFLLTIQETAIGFVNFLIIHFF